MITELVFLDFNNSIENSATPFLSAKNEMLVYSRQDSRGQILRTAWISSLVECIIMTYGRNQGGFCFLCGHPPDGSGGTSDDSDVGDVAAGFGCNCRALEVTGTNVFCKYWE